MDKLEAILTLGKVLTEIDSVQIEHIGTLPYFLAQDDIVHKVDLATADRFWHGSRLVYCSVEAKIRGANYLFVDSKQTYALDTRKGRAGKGLYSAEVVSNVSLRTDVGYDVVPFIVIGDREKDILAQKIYSDVPENIERALKKLGIENHIKAYQFYHQKPHQSVHRMLEFHRKNVWWGDGSLQNELSVGDLTQFYFRGRYHSMLITSIRDTKDWACEGPRIRFEGNELIKDKAHIPYTKDLHGGHPYREHIDEMFSKSYDIPFFFSLPEEHQNQRWNNIFLELSRNPAQLLALQYDSAPELVLDSVHHLLNHDVSFEDSFAHAVSQKEHQNYTLNSQLFACGLAVPVQYLDLYKTDAQGFKKYFEASVPEHKQEILQTLLNPELIESTQSPHEDTIAQWLDEKYKSLLERVGRGAVE